MITKEIELDKIEIVFVDGFPHTQARGKIVIKEDGKKIADAGTCRFNAKGPDQDAGDQPNISFRGENITLGEDVKTKLRQTQNVYATQDVKARFAAEKAQKAKI